ncbi:MAG: hypothetical protein JSW50_00565 [Candidatus Latescibacterota bacterium]|nr:MAG: hypothetical protein JSW50_00565 [Candidatus Latescibacterota bacterium]
MNRLLLTVAAILILFTYPPTATADERDLNDTAGLFLLFPSSTRNAAMGGAGVADDTDPINVSYNPANLALMRGGMLQGSYTKWPFDIRFLDVGIYGGTEYSGYEAYQSNIAGSIRYAKFSLDSESDLPVILPDSTGRQAGEEDWFIPATFALAMIRDQTYFAGGVTFKLVNTGFVDETIQFTTWDFGLAGGTSVYAREPYIFKLKGGVSWSNHGGSIEYGDFKGEPPAEFRAGLAFKFELIDADFSMGRSLITIDVNTDFLDSQQASGYLVGAELGVVETAYLRIGQRDQVFLSGGFAFGFGFQLKIKRFKLRADYAQIPAPLDQKADMFGLMIGTNY